MSELHHEIWGDPSGPRVLTIHGIQGHARRFEALAAGPWAHRNVLSVDLRGHGSSTTDAPWTFEQHVTDLLDTLDAAGWTEPVDVVGHSMGGAVATFLLACAPVRVRRVVLLDPALHRPGSASLAAARAAVTFPGFASVEEAAQGRRDTTDPSGWWVIDDELAAHLVEGADGRFRYRFEVAAVAAGWGELSRVTPEFGAPRPTLVVVADRADICGPAYLTALQDRLGDSLTVAHLDCGHMVYWERPQETAALVEAFLSAAAPSR